MRRFVVSVSVVGASLLSFGCDQDLSTVTGPTPNLETTFSSIQRDIFNAPDSAGRAACTSCHNNQGARFSGNLNLADATSYGQLVGVSSTGKTGAVRVIPGDPTGSYLIQKIEGAPGIVGERMPRTGGPFLTPGQITIIRRWIQLGAPNN